MYLSEPSRCLTTGVLVRLWRVVELPGDEQITPGVEMIGAVSVYCSSVAVFIFAFGYIRNN